MRRESVDRRNAPSVVYVCRSEKYRSCLSERHGCCCCFETAPPVASWLKTCRCKRMKSREISSKWSPQGWANRASTCQPKMLHVWMKKCQCDTYLLWQLHHFLWEKKKKKKKPNSGSSSLSEDTVSPSGSLLQWQSFVSDLEAATSHWHTVDLVFSFKVVQHVYPLLGVWMCLSVSCSYESWP